MLCAICFNLDQSKILLSGNGLKDIKAIPQPSLSVLVDPIMAKMNAFKVSIAYGISYCCLKKVLKKNIS